MSNYILHEKVVILNDDHDTEVYEIESFISGGKYLGLISPTGRHIARSVNYVRPASEQEKHLGYRLDNCTSCYDSYDRYIQYTPCFPPKNQDNSNE